MKIWIVWLPNVWKSTLFNALTKSYAADSANFPFCTIEPNVWVVDVKDIRLDKLCEISNSKNKVYANIKYVDIAWLVRWASKWEWLWNKFLAHIREVDAIVQVVRNFNDSDVVHVEGSIDVMRDIEIINSELIIADLEQIEDKLHMIEKKAKSKDKEATESLPILVSIKKLLEQGKVARDIRDQLSEKEIKILRQYNFLTFKPFIYAINISETDIVNSNEIKFKFEKLLCKPIAVVCAKLESELLELSDGERSEYLSDISWWKSVPTLDSLIKLSFDTVGLMYYFTSWEKESRAWTVKKWSTAPQAAWVIHTDFERWFIKAEVINYDKFVTCWWWQKSKEAWAMKLEGKDYIVKDGDVILFKFNV